MPATNSEQNIIISTLKQFGLNDNEVQIYLFLLGSTETGPYQISQKTGIPRTTVYDSLASLASKGLIETKSDSRAKQQAIISAKDPLIFISQIQKNRQDLSILESQFFQLLPQLLSSVDTHKDDSSNKVRYYSGVDSAKKLIVSDFDGKSDIPLYVFDNLDAQGVLVDSEEYEKMKVNIDVKEIIQLSPWTKHMLVHSVKTDLSQFSKREIRLVDNPLYDLSVRVSIKGNCSRFISVQSNQVWAVEIHSAQIARTLLSFFWMIWISAKPLTLDMLHVWKESENALETLH